MTISFGKWSSRNFISERETSMEKHWIMIKNKNGTTGNQFNEVKPDITMPSRHSERQDKHIGLCES